MDIEMTEDEVRALLGYIDEVRGCTENDFGNGDPSGEHALAYDVAKRLEDRIGEQIVFFQADYKTVEK